MLQRASVHLLIQLLLCARCVRRGVKHSPYIEKNKTVPCPQGVTTGEEAAGGKNQIFPIFQNKRMGQRRDELILPKDGQRSFLKKEMCDLDLKGQVHTP